MKIRKIIVTGLCLIISTGTYAKPSPIITEVPIDFAAPPNGEISIIERSFTVFAISKGSR